MSPASVKWRPNSMAPTVPSSGRSGVAQFAFGVGTVLVFLLLFGFYSVVSGAVRRADEGRQHARAEADRKALCGAFAGAPMRDRCGTAIAGNAPPNTVLRAAYVQPTWSGRRPDLTARVD